MLLFLYVFLVVNDTFDTNEHRYLILGHSFSASDRDFALIEKRAKHCKLVYVEDVQNAIRTAKLHDHIKCLIWERVHFFYFDSASSKYIDTSKLVVSKASCLRITKEYPGVVFYKTSVSDLAAWAQQNVFKRGVAPSTIWIQQHFQLYGRLYPCLLLKKLISVLCLNFWVRKIIISFWTF